MGPRDQRSNGTAVDLVRFADINRKIRVERDFHKLASRKENIIPQTPVFSYFGAPALYAFMSLRQHTTTSTTH